MKTFDAKKMISTTEIIKILRKKTNTEKRLRLEIHDCYSSTLVTQIKETRFFGDEISLNDFFDVPGNGLKSFMAWDNDCVNAIGKLGGFRSVFYRDEFNIMKLRYSGKITYQNIIHHCGGAGTVSPASRDQALILFQYKGVSYIFQLKGKVSLS